MHVIFVRNVQERCWLLLPARLVTGLYWTVAILSSVDAPLAVDLLSLTDVKLYARLTEVLT